MRAISTVVAAFCLISCRDRPSSSAARDSLRWILLDTSDSVTLTLDTASVVRTDSARFRVWVRFRYMYDQPASYVTDNRPFRIVEERMDVDCPSRKLRRSFAVYFDTARTVAKEVAADSQWFEAIPVSPGELILDSTCLRRSLSHSLLLVDTGCLTCAWSWRAPPSKVELRLCPGRDPKPRGPWARSRRVAPAAQARSVRLHERCRFASPPSAEQYLFYALVDGPLDNRAGCSRRRSSVVCIRAMA